LILMGGMVAAFQIAKVAPSLPALRAEFDLPMFAAGWIASVYPGTAVVLGLAGGILSDRFGPQRAMVAGLLFVAIGGAIGSLTPGYGILLLSRVVEGSGFVLMVVSGPALAMRSASAADRETSLGVWTMFMPLGLTAMYLVAPLFLVDGWRVLWQVNVVAALIMALVVYGATREPPRSAAVPGFERLWRDLRTLVARPGPWLLSACFGLFAILFGSVMTWFPSMMIEAHGRSVAAAGGLTAVIAAVHAPGSLLGGWLMRRRIARPWVFGTGALLMGAGGATAFHGEVPFAVALGAAMVFSLAGGTLPPSIIAGAREHAPDPAQVGAFNGILIHGANAGVLLGPPMFGAAVSNLGGWTEGGACLVALSLLALPLALALRRIERRFAVA
jgi:MFS family permease